MNTPSRSDPVFDGVALAEALRPAILKLGRQLRRDTQLAGMSATDAHLLAVVGKRPGIGVSDLARVEQMSSPSMSAHVKRLKAAGWLADDPCTGDDQRRVYLLLTPEGQAAIDAIRRSRNDWLKTHLAALSEDERAALAAAADALRHLSEMRP